MYFLRVLVDPGCVARAILGVLLLAGCASTHRGTTQIEGVRAVDPRVAALTPDQKLDRALSLPGMKGVVQGTVGKTLSVRTLTGGPTVTLDDFTVEQTFGFAPSTAPAFTAGQHVPLAIPGGRAGGQITTAEDAPTLHGGDHLLVFDQVGAGGQLFAVLGRAVIVLADRSAAARINPDGAIAWQGFSEPAASFTQHFISHPAHS